MLFFLLVILLFILTTLLAIVFFLRLTGRSVIVWVILAVWLLLQALLGISGFYAVTDTVLPRFGLALLPPLLCIACLFLFPRGRAWLDGMDLRVLTILHVVRIPVECTLFALFLYGQVPAIMTFEGGNFDILSGASAPVVYYFCFVKKAFDKRILLAWNVVCLFLVVNIAMHAVLSAPFRFQRFGFEQPNRALFYFPFIWLPAFIVPLVVFSHLVAIRRLMRG